MLNIDLKNKVAFVLGGSRGIGAAITQGLCQAGATTVFTHTGNSRYKDRVDGLLQSIEGFDGCAKAKVADACNSEETTKLAKGVAGEYGKIDILVANVGQNAARPAESVRDEQWSDGIKINLDSAFYGVRAVLPYMIEAGYGRIILIGSSAVYDGGGGAIGYAAAKAGLNGMMVYLARNYARKGIVTNVVHPCVIETDLLRQRYCDEEKKKQLIAQIPAGRLGRPKDIAGLVVYLASEWGDFICGQSILVDGGRTLFG